MTEKLYEEDSYMTCFHAQVISCCKGKNGYEIELERTAFYPEGGGQPADTGRLLPEGPGAGNIGRERSAEGKGCEEEAEAAGAGCEEEAEAVGAGCEEGAEAVGAGCEEEAEAVGAGCEEGAEAVGAGCEEGAEAVGAGCEEEAEAAGAGCEEGAEAVGAGCEEEAEAVGAGCEEEAEAVGAGCGKAGADSETDCGEVTVTDVRVRDGRILHICSTPLEPGCRVYGEIDWERRFRHSQQHSGEHIFSGIVHKLYGYDNVGFHMGRDAVTVDFDGMLTGEEIERAEQLANEAIYADKEIRVGCPSQEELKELPYRSKKELEGPVRIVTVPGSDICACCGTHVKRTGEIGMIKAVESMKYKGGVRITLQIGQRALEDYGSKNRQLRELCRLFSAKPEGLPEAAKAQQEAMASLKYRMTALKLRLFEELAGKLEGKETACLFEEELSAVEVRQLCDLCIHKVRLAAVFSGSEEEGYKYVLGAATEQTDVTALGKRLNESLCGRGGGRGNMVQGSVSAGRAAIEGFLRKEGLL